MSGVIITFSLSRQFTINNNGNVDPILRAIGPGEYASDYHADAGDSDIGIFPNNFARMFVTIFL